MLRRVRNCRRYYYYYYYYNNNNNKLLLLLLLLLLLQLLLLLLQCKEHKPSICPLLFSRQYSRRVNNRDAFQYGIRHVGALEPVEECVAKL